MKKYSSKTFNYKQDFKNTNFRENPEKYQVGIGEQGVLMVEPYKSEILPFWRFKTFAIATASAKKIFSLFKKYKKQDDFVGMDMARKFLQMGYTRSRRYANHKSGQKYVTNPQAQKNKTLQKVARTKVIPQEKDWGTSEKADSARIFYEYYLKVKEDKIYKEQKTKHKEFYG